MRHDMFYDTFAIINHCIYVLTMFMYTLMEWLLGSTIITLVTTREAWDLVDT